MWALKTVPRSPPLALEAAGAERDVNLVGNDGAAHVADRQTPCGLRSRPRLWRALACGGREVGGCARGVNVRAGAGRVQHCAAAGFPAPDPHTPHRRPTRLERLRFPAAAAAAAQGVPLRDHQLLVLCQAHPAPRQRLALGGERRPVGLGDGPCPRGWGARLAVLAARRPQALVSDASFNLDCLLRGALNAAPNQRAARAPSPAAARRPSPNVAARRASLASSSYVFACNSSSRASILASACCARGRRGRGGDWAVRRGRARGGGSQSAPRGLVPLGW